MIFSDNGPLPFVNRGASRRIGATLVALTMVAIAGCSESKVAQCNSLIEIANQAATEVEQVTQSADPENTDAFLSIATAADQASRDLEEVELSDDQLEEFKQQFITLYAEISQAILALVDAVEQSDREAMEIAYNDLETATSQESPLVDEVNNYCGGTPEANPE